METVAFAAVHADGPANGALLTISSNATMIENLPVDIRVRISMFLKLPCRFVVFVSLALPASLVTSSFFKMPTHCGMK
jgi:hypothetical protein